MLLAAAVTEGGGRREFLPVSGADLWLSCALLWESLQISYDALQTTPGILKSFHVSTQRFFDVPKHSISVFTA